MVTTFYDLYPDIVFELFSYFNIHEIFYSFCVLIPRLPRLLIDGYVRLHVRSNNAYFIRWILPHIQLSQVFSLDLPKRPYNPSLFRFIGLRSLVLRDVDEPLKLLEKSQDWPPYYLEHLSFHIRNIDVYTKPSNVGTRVLEQVLQLTRLKSFELHESKSSFKMVELSDQLILPSKFQSSNLQSLILTVYSNWKTLQSILSYTPHLRYLQFSSSIISSEKQTLFLPFSHLRQLRFRLDGLRPELLRNLISQTPVLRQLKLTSTVDPTTQCYLKFLQSETWTRLIDTYTPHLRILDIDLEFYLDEFDDKAIRTINEDFQKFNFEFDINSDNRYQSWKLTGRFRRQKNI